MVTTFPKTQGSLQMHGSYQGIQSHGNVQKSSFQRDLPTTLLILRAMTSNSFLLVLGGGCTTRKITFSGVMCPGASFAIHIIEFVLTDLLRYFDWELPNGTTVEDLDMAEEGGIISPKEIPLHLVQICHFPLCD
ncbi:cytochrome P450 71A1-like protein [Cinnamomum micranthum f. kanehirae]|uniref:Cytochrome P450 71A1-like protein n=1 Tax=Cinnamomum micranthum f. kanehirae TaxID=337451 RepID=A0A3S3NA70_9MAGN|nr:cytochrome P450 71A1-like protein [Cinnamomum micranthum f. kanehirae]